MTKVHLRAKKGVREDDLDQMVDILCVQGTCASIECIAMSLTLYNLCGRGGKLGLVNFGTATWNHNNPSSSSCFQT